MFFADFDRILHTCLGGKKSPKDFTRDLLNNITEFEDADNPLNDLSDELLRKLYTGDRKIRNTARAILPYLDTNKFANYLTDICQDGAAECIVASLAEKNIVTCQHELIDDLTELYKNILIDSTKTKRASAKKSESSEDSNIREYLALMKELFYSAKTLLYTSMSRPVYDFYVPNDLYDPLSKQGCVFDPLARHGKKRIPAAEVLLSPNRKFTVITGTGGLGKTMLMRYLILTMIKNYPTAKKIPVVIKLREFNNDCTDLAEFIVKQVPIIDISEHMKNGDCVFLLDGMDEIKSSYIKPFEKQLSDMAQKYPKNTFIMSSRPISNFIALEKFTVYELAPFTKEQALEMIDKAVYCPETPEVKVNFRKQLDETLFKDHQDFAENPLLLTIMLMTFERYARIPAKRYVFYREAFDTLVEKHDATKVGYSRLYQTHMFPEE
ncbi:MAG: NACHT domain-containing protein, partial [Oscillospiraceae bacterium]|nr:NACHT domain-containing protein [Oscillospiraceae bacterium]